MKNVHINESKIRNAVRKTINEITYGKVENTIDTVGGYFEALSDGFDEFYNALREVSINMKYDHTENRYIYEIAKHAMAIKEIIDKKLTQSKRMRKDYLDNIDQDRYLDDYEEKYDSLPDLNDAEMSDLRRFYAKLK